MRQLFSERGVHAGREAGRKVGKLALEKINFQELKVEVRKVAIASAEKYAVKAREFVKMAVRIAEEAGAKSGSELGRQLGLENGEEIGSTVGEKVGREAGEKAARDLAGKFLLFICNVVYFFFQIRLCIILYIYYVCSKLQVVTRLPS